MRFIRRKAAAAVALAVALAVGTVGVVVGASDTTFDGTTATDPAPASKRDGQARRDRQGRQLPPNKERCRKGPFGSTQPARLLSEDAAWIPTNVHITVNAWRTADCRRQTTVWAGVSGSKWSTGMFVFERHGDWPRARMMLVINVPNSGAAKITNFPRGPDVISSAQRDGVLEFTSRRGVTGMVNLADDTVTLSTGEVIEAVPYG